MLPHIHLPSIALYMDYIIMSAVCQACVLLCMQMWRITTEIWNRYLWKVRSGDLGKHQGEVEIKRQPNNVSNNCVCVLSSMGRGYQECSWNWHPRTWPGFPGWWWWQTTTGRDGPLPEQWTASLLSSGGNTHTNTKALTVSTESAVYCMYSVTHEHRWGMFGTLCAQEVQTDWITSCLTESVMSCRAHFSLCHPCPASSAARPCMSQRRWLTSGWEGGSDSSCQCPGAAEAALCSHIWKTETQR